MLLFFPLSEIFAQISHSFQLNYGGVELDGSVDILIQIIDNDPKIKKSPLSFSGNEIKVDVSKFKKPALIVILSNLQFDAPKNLIEKLSLNISPPSLPKGFNQNIGYLSGAFKVNDNRKFTFGIIASDTILVGNMKFNFSSIKMGKRVFKLKNNAFQISLNIKPPALFPPKASEKELWEIATKLNTLKAYKTYTKRFPQGKSVREAKRKERYLKENRFQNIVSDISTQTPIFYYDENEYWKKASRTNKIESYNAYLKEFPKGKYAQKAKSTVKSLSDSLDVKLLNFTEEELLGRIIYHIADTMTIGQTYRVRLEISSDTTTHFIEKLIENVEEYSDHPEDLKNEIIQIGKTMHAHLVESNSDGDKNFNIQLFGDSNERPVKLYSGKPTIWQWDVKPLNGGSHPLVITIEIVTIKDGDEMTVPLPVYDKKIVILSLSIFETYKTQWISGGIISVLVLVILFLFIKKKKEAKTDQNLEKLIKSKPLEGAIILVEKDKVKETLNLLNQFLDSKDSEILQEVILLKSRLSGNDVKLHKAIISKEAATNERNSIKLAVLDIIERAKTFRKI